MPLYPGTFISTLAKRSFTGVAFLCCICVLSYPQTPTPTPSQMPDDRPPVYPTFQYPVRPLPSAERLGVDLANQLSLTLAQAIEMALKNNNDIDASRNTAQIAGFELTG